MQILNRDGGSSWVVKAIHGLDTECKHDGDVEHQWKNNDGEDPQPGGQLEITVAVVYLQTQGYHRVRSRRTGQKLVPSTWSVCVCVCVCVVYVCVCVCVRVCETIVTGTSVHHKITRFTHSTLQTGTHLSYHKWHCSNLFFWKGKGQIPFLKVLHPPTEKPKAKALVGFKARTEPELGTRDSHSTSTPPPFTPVYTCDR